ncbi:MAG: L,D-transpeptidase family protein [Eubacterium sp.]|nr:L,D-transpeptidase family protein [Eubacterium sp.]
MKTRKHSLAKRVIVLVLAALMLVGSVGATAVFAEENTENSSSSKVTVQNGIDKSTGKPILYKDGVKITKKGKYQVGGSWYYVQKNGIAAVKKFVKFTSNGKKKLVYYDKDGKAVRAGSKAGFVTIGKYKYYIKADYSIVTGWKTINGKRYYFNPKKNGRMLVNVTKKINGTTYYFNKKGVVQLGDPAINKKAQSYTSPTKKLILVNRGKHKVSIYQGKKGKWKCIKYWPCVVGQITMQTPVGVHHLTGFKGAYFDSHGLRWWYFTCYKGNRYHFHSQGYSQTDIAHTKLINGAMNENASAGCIRLYLENARWLQKNCPQGTTVVIYN